MARGYPKGQKMWLAYPGEVRQVQIVEKGAGDTVFRRGERPRDPYIVEDPIDEERFVIGSEDLYHNPLVASIAAAKLSKQLGVPYEANPTEEEEEEDDGDEEDETEEDDGDDEDDEDD